MSPKSKTAGLEGFGEPLALEENSVSETKEWPVLANNNFVPFDESRYYLGTLCKRGHDYCGTGLSLRYPSRHCVECLKERPQLPGSGTTEERRESHRRYDRSEKGQERRQRYNQSDKAKKYRKGYNQSEEAKKARQRWEQSEKGKQTKQLYRQTNEAYQAWLEQYQQSEKQKESNRQACRRYRQSEKGNENRRSHDARRRLLKIENPGAIPITPERKSEIKRQFDNCCAYCKAPLTDCHWEHVIALSKGGLDSLDNLLPSCPQCNLSKNDSFLEEWYPKQPFFTPERYQHIQGYLKEAERLYDSES